ncbi:helix-turn-helix domain-containing protein [Pleionea mediterranea]|uniref:Transcriptional regulator with XRE-family HTH domain n=1 Tax=Pleionea mediterranea TaxID=523701 RepID=A0A316FMU7_9GAMM|nr:helix-turn-helix transcriptional regulator [Pleionea mediterranea]PWK50054.1 transcriptional regulator with XRE-family HTH domain [Pleionea mediterranea]
MEVKQEIIKEYRKRHGWTQQNLADACDLSLRTVQRVEKSGNASNETVMSLCAVLEISQQYLKRVPEYRESELQQVKIRPQYLPIACAVLIGLIAGASLMYWWLSV